jgi:hypothetical protein
VSFETSPAAFKIRIGARGGELEAAQLVDFEKLALRGDLRGLALLYRMRRKDEVARYLSLLMADLAGRVQLFWRQLLYYPAPAGATGSGYKIRRGRMPVTWRGDYARAIRVRRNRYGASVYVDHQVARYLAALERGTRAIGRRYFAFRAEKGLHPFVNKARRFDTANYYRFGRMGDERKRPLMGRQLDESESNLQDNLQNRYEGGQGEGTQRILEWARERFGAGEDFRSRTTRDSRGVKRKGVLVNTHFKKKPTKSAVDQNAYRLLVWIRTHGTKPAAVFSRLRDSVKQGSDLHRELEQVSARWYQALKDDRL